MMNCRRCEGDRLLELGRLDVRDHRVFRCRWCGFLFSPPEQDVMTHRGVDVEQSAPPRDVASLGGPPPARNPERRRSTSSH